MEPEYHRGGATLLSAIFHRGVSLRRTAVACLLGFGVLGCEPESTESIEPQTPAASSGAPVDIAPSQPPDLGAPAVAEPEPKDAGVCPERDDPAIGVLTSPRRPIVGEPVTVLAATLETEMPLAMRLDGEGDLPSIALTHRPGVPSAVLGRFTASEEVKVVVGREGQGLACLTIRPKRRTSPRPRPASAAGVWPVSRRWDAGEEALYSAWVRELFTAPAGEDLAWKRFDLVSADASRNLLHDAHGWAEDAPDRDGGLRLKPDCADLPYFLRAYYAWKRELPFGYRRCSRGKGKAPECGMLRGVVGPPENEPDRSRPGELGAVQKFFKRTLAWGVHSGNGRTALDADDTDFYPVALRRDALRPGTTYADPYGHLFVLVEWVPAAKGRPGILYAVDGQPDGSITRKRFWEGNFLWNPDPLLGGSGFKAFRPHRVETAGDVETIAVPTNADLAAMAGYDDFSLEQGTLTPAQFYDRMDTLITPGRRDAIADQKAAMQALLEAAKVRVTSVKNGDAHVAKGRIIDMPDGHAIFETTGAWENFSTPARDLRLLIAIDLVRGFEDKVARNAEVYLNEGQSMDDMRVALKAAREVLLADPKAKFSYTRSDGSEWELTVADVVERAEAFELGYNPNDCPEVRWGAPEGSEERKTCRRRAPELQRRKMKAYRAWFDKRQRPPRGDPGPKVD